MSRWLVMGAASVVTIAGVAIAYEAMPAGRPLEVERIVRVIGDVEPPEAPTPPAAPKHPEKAHWKKSAGDAEYAVRLFEDEDAGERILAITDCDGETVVLRGENGRDPAILNATAAKDALIILDAASHAGGMGDGVVIDISGDNENGFAFITGDDEDRFVLRFDDSGGFMSGVFSEDVQDAIEDAMEEAAEARAEAAEEAREAIEEAAEALEDAMSEMEDQREEMAERLRGEEYEGYSDELRSTMRELARSREELRRAERQLHAEAMRAEREMARVEREVRLNTEKLHALRKDKRTGRFEACVGDECENAFAELKIDPKVMSKKIVKGLRSERTGEGVHVSVHEDRRFLVLEGLDAEGLKDFIKDLDGISDDAERKLIKKLGLG
ncbi:MAG: hypothetical protein AAFR11_04965 [Pseudomonadota bacterium]